VARFVCLDCLTIREGVFRPINGNYFFWGVESLNLGVIPFPFCLRQRHATQSPLRYPSSRGSQVPQVRIAIMGRTQTERASAGEVLKVSVKVTRQVSSCQIRIRSGCERLSSNLWPFYVREGCDESNCSYSAI